MGKKAKCPERTRQQVIEPKNHAAGKIGSQYTVRICVGEQGTIIQCDALTGAVKEAIMDKREIALIGLVHHYLRAQEP